MPHHYNVVPANQFSSSVKTDCVLSEKVSPPPGYRAGDASLEIGQLTGPAGFYRALTASPSPPLGHLRPNRTGRLTVLA